jgi:hypothetical protein
LCTPAAQQLIAWAADRSLRRMVPTLVSQEWAVAGEIVPPEALR